METPVVFFDATGRRRRWTNRVGALGALAAALLTTFFAFSLLVVPVLPGVGLHPVGGARLRPGRASLFRSRESALDRFRFTRARSALRREIQADTRAPASPPALEHLPRIVAGFYAGWQRNGLSSLRANAGRMTHLMPDWIHLDSTGLALDTRDWDPALTPGNLEAVAVARRAGLRITPVLSNAQGGRFDSVRAARLLAAPAARQRAFARQVRDWVVRQDFQGVNLDLENLRPADYDRLPPFLALLSAELRASGRSLSVDLEPELTAARMAALAAPCDFAILMAYGEHWPGSGPGALASPGWYLPVLRRAAAGVPRGKLVLGLGSFGYDWSDDGRPAAALSYQASLLLAHEVRPDSLRQPVLDFDREALSPTFDYTDDGGRAHEVWMLDAVTAYDQWALARSAAPRGAALWVLGSEDPGVWSFLDRSAAAAGPGALRRVRFPYQVEFQGTGEFLRVESTPKDGERSISVDPRTGLIDDERYLSLPSTYVVRRSGYRPGVVAFTFDDGPDPEYTAAILDVLKEYGVPATFFTIGENAERAPELIRREWAEGHEVGNHSFTHPDLGAVSPRRAELEINATQRALESILGRSTLLFRPPYNADTDPSTSDQVLPVVRATGMGYLTVSASLDPQDWNLAARLPDGSTRARTGHDIAESILALVKAGRGNVVLLHDGGGDRSATVEALREVIPDLREEGYRFVPLSGLVGSTRAALMPPVTARERRLVGVDRAWFEVAFTAARLLTAAFVFAIALAFLRAAAVLAGALLARRRERRRTWDPSYRPSVSVLIAAYDEEPVIVRTVHSVLADGYPGLEVVVVDDGSRDGTTAALRREFAADPRVVLVRQANAGKAAALNRALSRARGEVVVCFDADTQVAPGAIARLVRHFSDAGVGAVAGNVRVGNVTNLLTRWQSIEYVTSQNLDRRAYARVNGVPVVPGAAGAWRAAALRGVGGYLSDTLAEDMDLSIRLRRAGWRTENETGALAFTEAPDRLRSLARQRFRWAYGTLQCLWKHRGALLRHGWFGWAVLPGLWLFQVVLPVLAPVVDLQMLWGAAGFLHAGPAGGVPTADWEPALQAATALRTTALFYGLFFAVELMLAAVAFRLDRQRPGALLWLFWQRFVYRQMMYFVLWRSLLSALRGARHGWGKLDRTATVRVEPGLATVP